MLAFSNCANEKLEKGGKRSNWQTTAVSQSIDSQYSEYSEYLKYDKIAGFQSVPNIQNTQNIQGYHAITQNNHNGLMSN